MAGAWALAAPGDNLVTSPTIQLNQRSLDMRFVDLDYEAEAREGRCVPVLGEVLVMTGRYLVLLGIK